MINSENILKETVKKIKEKKELSGLSDQIVEDSLIEYLEKYKINLERISKYQLKIIIKELRSELRLLTGRFQKSLKSRENLSESDLLKTHTSTAERLDYYPELKRIIKKIKPNSILDLACGLNPIALADKKTKYFASDINEKDLLIVEEYFKKNKIKGQTFIYDLRKMKSNLPETDLSLLFKVLDIIDKNLAEKIIKSIPSKVILVSFATKKLSGKKMSSPKRTWFEKILERLNLKYETFNSANEIFYYILK